MRARASGFGQGGRGADGYSCAAPEGADLIDAAVAAFLSSSTPAAATFPLADWALPQIAYAFESLRTAVTMAVSAAETASADAEAANGRAAAAERALNRLRIAVQEDL